MLRRTRHQQLVRAPDVQGAVVRTGGGPDPQRTGHQSPPDHLPLNVERGLKSQQARADERIPSAPTSNAACRTVPSDNRTRTGSLAWSTAVPVRGRQPGAHAQLHRIGEMPYRGGGAVGEGPTDWYGR